MKMRIGLQVLTGTTQVSDRRKLNESRIAVCEEDEDDSDSSRDTFDGSADWRAD
jgi:hypothetical protein